MANPRINIKNIDYFKYKKIIIDGNRDDYNECSKEVKDFCDTVQTIRFRDEEFDDECDRGRFGEICRYYRQILASKRIDPTDMRIKSGWWGDHKNAYSAGKLKVAALRDTLLTKADEYAKRSGFSHEGNLSEKIDGPGLFVFKHKDHQCFQYVGRADKIFSSCGERLKTAFEGHSEEPLASLIAISMANDWEFYFMPVGSDGGCTNMKLDDDRVLRVLENDLILKHDCIWPHGLNFRLHIDSLLEVSQFRKSCVRHHWPPDVPDSPGDSIDLTKLRHQISSSTELSPSSVNGDCPSITSSMTSLSTPPKKVDKKQGGTGSASSKPRPTSAAKKEVKKPATPRPNSARSKPTKSALPKPTEPEPKPEPEPASPDSGGSHECSDGGADDNVDNVSDASDATYTLSGSGSNGSLASIGDIAKEAPSPSKIPSSPRKAGAKKKPVTPRPTSGKGRTERTRLPVTSPKKH